MGELNRHSVVRPIAISCSPPFMFIGAGGSQTEARAEAVETGEQVVPAVPCGEGLDDEGPQEERNRSRDYGDREADEVTRCVDLLLKCWVAALEW